MDSWKICSEPQLPEVISQVPDLQFSIKTAHWKNEMIKNIFGIVFMAEMLAIILKKLKNRHHFSRKQLQILEIKVY